MCDPECFLYNINSEEIKKKLTKKRKYYLSVHVYGLPCKMAEIMKMVKENNLFVIEDCAQSFSAKYRLPISLHEGSWQAGDFWLTAVLVTVG